MNKISVRCEYNKDIVNIITESHNGNSIQEIARGIIKLQEHSVKQALIKLGWTPPGGE